METRSGSDGCLRKLLGVLAGGLLLGVVFSALLTVLGAVLIISDPLKRSDAIVLLSGGDRSRLDEVVALYEQKYAGMIVLTETGEQVPGFGTAYSREQRDVLLDMGIPLGAIEITEKTVGSTREEAKVIRALLGSRRVHDVIVVTDAYHTLRTRIIFHEVFAGSGMSVAIRPVRSSWYRSTTWWLSARGWEATVSEYFKLSYYLIGQELK